MVAVDRREVLMVGALLFCLATIGDDGSPKSKAPSNLAIYESAQAKAGKDAAAQVRLALWCEQHGFSAERVKHLALAIAYDPKNSLAHGLAGLVAFHGTWKSLAEVGREVKNDAASQELIRDYLDRRAQAPHTAPAQLKLAAWCAEKGLKEQALAHFTEVTRIDPSRETAWKHLGYRKQGNRWVKPEEAAAQKLEADRQKRADLYWKPRLEKLRGELQSSSSIEREKARASLAETKDPRSVPMIWRVFGAGNERLQLTAVQLFSQVEGPAASFWLAVLAVQSPSADVRQRATQALNGRDPRDVIGLLIGLVRRPYKYEVKPGTGPGSTGSLMVDGEQFDMQRFYRMPDFDVRLMPSNVTVFAPGNGTPGSFGKFLTPALIAFTRQFAGYMSAQQDLAIASAVEETRRRDLAIQQRMDDDIRMLDEANAQITEIDGRVLPLLQTLTGQDFGTNSKAWQQWWTDQLGLVVDSSSSDTKPTFTDTIATPDTTLNLPTGSIHVLPHHACFAAGTLVHTIDGPQPIEWIHVGDLVLSQSTTTGALAFHPVVAVHLNKPQPTLRLTARGESIVATGIHRFWKAGDGWTMARDLKAGESLRVVGGVAAIESISSDATQPVYNLDVASNRNFCVGKAGLLVHDFSFVQPVLSPFDAQGDTALGLPHSAVLRDHGR
jgi:tetratricopeptide (TPR) repeat protein